MSTRLAGKVIVVIGGTTGLGFSAARAFVDEGASVVVVGRNPDSASAACEAFGEAGRAVVGDASESGTAPRAILEALNAFGGFHGLYHVAGGSGRRMGDGPLHELTDEGLRVTLEINLEGLIYSSRAAVRQFLSQGSGGSILHMGSVLGWSPSPQYFSTHAYAAAKAAVIGFTRSAASYYAPQNIRLNCIAPGLVETPMARRASQDAVISAFVSRKQPLCGGRLGQPEDMDGAAVYFLSDESRFTTGQILAVDGGWEVSEGV